jgi:hypothetical protein
VIVRNCPWPSSQFNKWHTQHSWLASSLTSSIKVHSPSHQRTIVVARLVLYFYLPNFGNLWQDYFHLNIVTRIEQLYTICKCMANWIQCIHIHMWAIAESPSHKPLMIVSCSFIFHWTYWTSRQRIITMFMAWWAFLLFHFKEAGPKITLWIARCDSRVRIGGITIIVHDPAAGVKNHVLSWRCHPCTDSSLWRHAHSV